MKKHRNILVCIAIITVLLLALYGCAKTSCSEIDAVKGSISSPITPPFSIKNIAEHSSYKDELVRHILASKTGTEKDAYYGEWKISDIKEFYYPTVIIDGYEICEVSISDAAFSFFYIPVGGTNFMRDTGIIIDIMRPEYVDASDPFGGKREILDRDTISYIDDGNMMYIKDMNDMTAIIGNTLLCIRVPNRLNNYEYLHKLCLDVINNSELVTVGD